VDIFSTVIVKVKDAEAERRWENLPGLLLTSLRRFGKLLVFGFTADTSGGANTLFQSAAEIRPDADTSPTDYSGPNSAGELSLLIHLGMTGQLVYRSPDSEFGGGHPNRSLVGQLPDFTTRAVLRFSAGNLFFNDQRLFGSLELIPTAEVEHYPYIAKLGPEPLHADSADLAKFLQRIRHHPKIAVKTAILDQSIAAGVGNIYADEGLWMTKIHPRTPVGRLSDQELTELFANLAKVFQISLTHGGSTSRNYVNSRGEAGKYLEFAGVYGREGLPCRNCGTPIEKIKLGGRGTHFCPHCQVPVT
jgi:formamidopyrimidine-DNA glycosylase